MRSFIWWLLPDLNWGHKALQASALPTELKSRKVVCSDHFTGEQTTLQPRYFFEWSEPITDDALRMASMSSTGNRKVVF